MAMSIVEAGVLRESSGSTTIYSAVITRINNAPPRENPIHHNGLTGSWKSGSEITQAVKAGKTLRDQLEFDIYLKKRSADPNYTFRRHLREIGGAIEEWELTTGTTKANKPGRLARFFFRMPIWLYRLKLGGLLGKRFVMFTHKGRRTGKPHDTIVEVVRYDEQTDSFLIASGWGETSDWVLNVKKMWLS